MRIAEKTLELNFCRQMNGHADLFWFGLTQRQERRAGYDAYVRRGGRLLVLQFKASNHVLKNGRRRFHAPHHQLENLQDRAFGTRDVGYVLPNFGTTGELTALGWQVVNNCWFLSAADIPAMPDPTRPDGLPRKNGTHYIDLDVAGFVVIHSDPIAVRASPMEGTAWLERSDDSAKDESPLRFESFDEFDNWSRRLGRGLGVVVSP